MFVLRPVRCSDTVFSHGQAHPQPQREGAKTIVIIYNSGMVSGDARLRASWLPDLQLLIDQQLLAIFTCANDYLDLAGERKLMQDLGAQDKLYPRRCPFAAASVLHPEGRRECWNQANSFVYAIQGRANGKAAAPPHCAAGAAARQACAGSESAAMAQRGESHRSSTARAKRPCAPAGHIAHQATCTASAAERIAAGAGAKPSAGALAPFITAANDGLSSGGAHADSKALISAFAADTSRAQINEPPCHATPVMLPNFVSLELTAREAIVAVRLDAGVAPSAVSVQSTCEGSKLEICVPGRGAETVPLPGWLCSKAVAKGSKRRQMLTIRVPRAPGVGEGVSAQWN